MFAVVSSSDKRYRVLVAGGREHAESVLADLKAAPGVPSDLKLKRVWRG